jgi:hypothetical protein
VPTSAETGLPACLTRSRGLRAKRDSLSLARRPWGRGMSPDPRARRDMQEGECRLLERSSDPANRSMSHFARMRSDMPRRACRSESSRGATSQPWHVARRAREDRHVKRSMSLRILARSDIPTVACRSTSSRRPTCEAERVARRNRLERHSRPRRSLHSTSNRDMDTHACRWTQVGEATFTRVMPRWHPGGAGHRARTDPRGAPPPRARDVHPRSRRPVSVPW